jgi:hypothetical protein
MLNATKLVQLKGPVLEVHHPVSGDWVMPHVDIGHAEQFGLRLRGGGTHQSKTMMFSEISAYWSRAEASSSHARSLIVDANVLNKRTVATRIVTFRHLNALYAIETMPTITKALAALWKLDGKGRPLLVKEQTLVQPFVYRPTERVELRLGVKVADSQPDGGKARRFTEIMAAHKRMQDDDEKEGMTASEALAFLLRIFLRELKHAEKNRKAAPVRTLSLVPRSLIAEIAMDLLGSCETWGHPPGPLLNSLMRELLNLEHDRQGMSRDVETQERAAGVVAQAPAVRTRELARALHVNASTISRWRRSPEFKQMVERKREALKARAGLSESIGSSEQGEPTQKELSQLLLAISVLFS